MMSKVEITASTADTVMFSLWVDGNRYDCPIAREVVYELSRAQDPAMVQIDAYLVLKEQVRTLVETLVRAGDVMLPMPLPASQQLH
jgi:hypothetical protein